MTDKIKNYITVGVTGLFFLVFFVWCLVKPADETSLTERRNLTQKPELTKESVLNGKYMTAFEKYATDQFPERDFFRQIKIFTAKNIIRNKDVNKYYQNNSGYISKIEYPLDEASISNATLKFNTIMVNSMKPTTKFYVSVIPDKNYYMADKDNVLHLDYEELISELTTQLPKFTYIDISNELTVDSFYKTDTHWRQEKITGVAETLANAMGATITDTFTENTYREDFVGVYGSQSGFNPKGEKLNYLTSALLDKCSVYEDPMNRKEMTVYDFEKGDTDDAYELFLSGTKGYVKIVNPDGGNGKRLYIFRDSFGSSLAPLMVSAYSEVHLIDIRSMSSTMVKKYVNFENADVLFIYSSLILNNSSTFK